MDESEIEQIRKQIRQEVILQYKKESQELERLRIDLRLRRNIIEEEARKQREKAQIEAQKVENERWLRSVEIPDAFLSLPEYSGKKSNLISWIDAVEKVLSTFSHLSNTIVWPLFIEVIRSKVVKKAHRILKNSHIPNDWYKIRNKLLDDHGQELNFEVLPYAIYRENTLQYYEKLEIKDNQNLDVNNDIADLDSITQLKVDKCDLTHSELARKTDSLECLDGKLLNETLISVNFGIHEEKLKFQNKIPKNKLSNDKIKIFQNEEKSIEQRNYDELYEFLLKTRKNRENSLSSPLESKRDDVFDEENVTCDRENSDLKCDAEVTNSDESEGILKDSKNEIFDSPKPLDNREIIEIDLTKNDESKKKLNSNYLCIDEVIKLVEIDSNVNQTNWNSINIENNNEISVSSCSTHFRDANESLTLKIL